MFTSGLHMQLHICSPTYTLAHIPDTRLCGKKNKNKVKGKKRTREPRKRDWKTEGGELEQVLPFYFLLLSKLST